MPGATSPEAGRTPVRVLRGRHKGRDGWISGSLEDRAARGITRALVHVGHDADMISTRSLSPVSQLLLPLAFAKHQSATLLD